MPPRRFLRPATKLLLGAAAQAGTAVGFERVSGVGHDREAPQNRSTTFFQQVPDAPR